MRKRIISLIMCAVLSLSLMAGCGKKSAVPAVPETLRTATDEEDAEADKAAASTTGVGEIKTLVRPRLLSLMGADLYDENLVPSVPEYSVDESFSNVINAADFVEGDHVTKEYKKKLAENLFVVTGRSGYEFFETYEFNAYSQTPNFVTVDSLMHTYHLYFAHLLKNLERSYLSKEIKDLCHRMFDESLDMYEDYEGTEWEEAAKMCVSYYAVACALCDENVKVPDYAKKDVEAELDKIYDASGIDMSAIVNDLNEDYSQYEPRGYYKGEKRLEDYFRTMMWLGRITFTTENEDNTRAAILMTLALDDDDAYESWEKVYAVTSFFAGASDDFGYCEYMPAIEKAYGDDPDEDELIGNDKSFEKFVKYVSSMEPPKIQSIPVHEYDETNVIPGFRMMGQRFTIDGQIMQNLIYRAVEQNDAGDMRMLPSVLDVPAALGSDMAKDIVLADGAEDFPDYIKNLDDLRSSISSASDDMWSASLYSQWIDTLRPILTKKGEGYPSFMLNEEWAKKNLETFAGSYTELKHDTILYGKQPMAEMGGGDMDDLDDRGYVEPEPLVFSRFSSLAAATRDGLKKYGMLGADDEKNLGLLIELSNKLLVIAQKELSNELPTDEEFDLIRNYGGNLEHFWYEAMREEADGEYFTSEEFPAGLVVDVATDPNGYVLEAGTGCPCEVEVIVPVDGKLRIATGSVYEFYEFKWPMNNRLDDVTWRQMVGAEPGEGYLYEKDDSMVQPDWTQSYREQRWNWEW